MARNNLLAFARAGAWTLAIAALLLVVLRYDALPAEMPLTRWRTAPKSWLIVVRAPAINLLSLALIEILTGSLRRLEGFTRASLVSAILLLTTGLKGLLLALAMQLLPAEPASLTALTLLVSLGGLCVAAFIGRDMLRGERLRKLAWTRTENASAIVLVLVLLAFELPLLWS